MLDFRRYGDDWFLNLGRVMLRRTSGPRSITVLSVPIWFRTYIHLRLAGDKHMCSLIFISRYGIYEGSGLHLKTVKPGWGWSSSYWWMCRRSDIRRVFHP